MLLPGPVPSCENWDLSHVDGSRTEYAGPEHRHARDCAAGGNRATTGRRTGPMRWTDDPRLGTELLEDGRCLVYRGAGRWVER